MKKIKILYLIDSLNIGGAQKHLISLISHLDKKKYDIHLCAFKSGPLTKEVKKLNIPFKILDQVRKPKIFGLNNFFSLLKFMKHKKFDIIDTLLFASTTWGIFTAKLSNISYRIAERRNLNHILKNKKRRLLFLRFVNLFTDKIIVVSEAVKNCVIKQEKLDPMKTKCIYNGVNLKEFDIKINQSKEKAKLGIKNNDKIIGVVARLVKEKDYFTLIKAFKQVNDKIKNSKLIIVGDGPLKENLEKYVKKQNLENNIKFLGKRTDIPKLIKIFEIFILSSLTEGFPNVVLEAMAASKQVVATNVGGIPEVVINGKTGILVPPTNPEALANTIIKLIKNPKLREKMGKAGRKRVEKYFTIKKMVKEYEKVYDRLVE